MGTPPNQEMNMLYDPKWDKPDAISLAGLIAWLERQNPATRYNYRDIHDCLLTRYFRASGYRWAYCGLSSFSYSRWFLPPLFRKAIPYEMNEVAVRWPSTYGDALKRARRLA
jgi:hypothetical protein